MAINRLLKRGDTRVLKMAVAASRLEAHLRPIALETLTESRLGATHVVEWKVVVTSLTPARLERQCQQEPTLESETLDFSRGSDCPQTASWIMEAHMMAHPSPPYLQAGIQLLPQCEWACLHDTGLCLAPVWHGLTDVLGVSLNLVVYPLLA
ncbi:Hypothetical predicted protein [Pelobates cultripes]|uniref:Uncharacterized protein n=1 Tax=Pelobates cultripes TaxID=61616 RepID=A0AAD1VMX5_PELCU|nr:Hypothetical predicted protein [Pelobates cultripes]